VRDVRSKLGRVPLVAAKPRTRPPRGAADSERTEAPSLSPYWNGGEHIADTTGLKKGDQPDDTGFRITASRDWPRLPWVRSFPCFAHFGFACA
jgi:hypothetical protein